MFNVSISLPSFFAPLLRFAGMFGGFPGVLLSVGDYFFSIHTAAYTELTRSVEHRWAEVPIIGAPPVLQYIGVGKQSIKLKGEVLPEYKGGSYQIEKLRRLADTGRPQPVVTGRGKFLGFWVIASIEETQTEQRGDGDPRVQAFNLELKYYGKTYPRNATG